MIVIIIILEKIKAQLNTCNICLKITNNKDHVPRVLHDLGQIPPFLQNTMARVNMLIYSSDQPSEFANDLVSYSVLIHAARTRLCIQFPTISLNFEQFHFL